MKQDAESAEYYEVLQVSPNAEPEVIAAAYKALARKYHPDRSRDPTATLKMAKVNRAYEVLSGPTARASRGRETEVRTERQKPLSSEHVDVNASLEEAMKIVTKKAMAARQKVADELMRDGLQHSMAVELADQAFKEIAVSRDKRGKSEEPLSGEHVDVNASLEEAMKTVTKKAMAARQIVADELTRDGLQHSMAVELTDRAFEDMVMSRSKTGKAQEPLSSEHVDINASLEEAMKIVTTKAMVARQKVLDELAKDGLPHNMAVRVTDNAFESISESGE